MIDTSDYFQCEQFEKYGPTATSGSNVYEDHRVSSPFQAICILNVLFYIGLYSIVGSVVLCKSSN